MANIVYANSLNACFIGILIQPSPDCLVGQRFLSSENKPIRTIAIFFFTTLLMLPKHFNQIHGH